MIGSTGWVAGCGGLGVGGADQHIGLLSVVWKITGHCITAVQPSGRAVSQACRRHRPSRRRRDGLFNRLGE